MLLLSGKSCPSSFRDIFPLGALSPQPMHEAPEYTLNIEPHICNFFLWKIHALKKLLGSREKPKGNAHVSND